MRQILVKTALDQDCFCWDCFSKTAFGRLIFLRLICLATLLLTLLIKYWFHCLLRNGFLYFTTIQVLELIHLLLDNLIKYIINNFYYSPRTMPCNKGNLYVCFRLKSWLIWILECYLFQAFTFSYPIIHITLVTIHDQFIKY